MALVRRCSGVTLGLLVAVCTAVRAQSDQSDTAKSRAIGYYTVEQLNRGTEVFRSQCAKCHSVADHTGPDFRLAWQGQTVRSLFDYLRGTMPDDDPGALSERQYLDVTAYLLKLNGMPAGDAPLVADTIALKKLVIDIKAPGSSGNGTRRLPLHLRRLLR